MKQIKYFFAALFLSMTYAIVYAQDTTSSSTTKITTKETATTTSSEWYTQPWVWIVGGAVFIIILIALLRGKPARDKVEISRSTTVIKDRNP